MNEAVLAISLIAILLFIIDILNRTPSSGENDSTSAAKPMPHEDGVKMEEASISPMSDKGTNNGKAEQKKIIQPEEKKLKIIHLPEEKSRKKPSFIFQIVSTVVGLFAGVFLGSFISLWFDIEPPSPVLVTIFMIAGVIIAQAFCRWKEKNSE